MRVKQFNKESGWYPFLGTRYGEDGKLIPPDVPWNDKRVHAYTPAGNTFVVGFVS